MDHRHAISEAKLRSEVFRQKSSTVVRIMCDRAWFNFPLNHPEDMRQYIYWLNFKRPKAWKIMDAWIKLYDSCVALLKQVLMESQVAMRDIQYVDDTNIKNSRRAAEEFVKPSLDLRWVARFYKENLDQPVNQQRKNNDVLLRSLDERDQFLDVHSKITHLYDADLSTNPYQILNNSVDYSRPKLTFDPLKERANFTTLPFNVNRLVISRPLKISLEDSELIEGILKFADCVIYLCEEISSELERLTRESDFKTSGFLKRIHDLREYQREKMIRGGYTTRKHDNKFDEDDEERRKKKLPPIDWNIPVISLKDLI